MEKSLVSMIEKREVKSTSIVFDRSFMYGRNIQYQLIVEDNDGNQYGIKDITMELLEPLTMMKVIFELESRKGQEMVDELYRLGYHPSDELTKDELVKTLKSEVQKRDVIINKFIDKLLWASKTEGITV